jgi:ketosteroid isomerase-like protein
MQRRCRSFVVAVCALIPLACNSSGDGVSEGTALAVAISTALAAGDAQQLGLTFADEAVLAAAEPTGMVLRTRQQIVAYYAANFPHLALNLSLRQTELQRLGDGSAVQRGEIGGSVVRKSDNVRIDARGTFVHVLKRRDDGSWAVFRAIWGFEHTGSVGLANEECSSCCCKTSTGCDCIKRPDGGCTNDFPIPVVKP